MVGGDDEVVDGGGLLGRRVLVAVEAIGGEDRALGERARDVVADVVGDLPAQRPRAELARARLRGGRGDAGALSGEVLARPQADEQPALAVGVGDGEVLEGRLGLAGVEQRLELAAARVVCDALALEDADGDGVGRGVARRVGGGGHAHGRPHHRLSGPLCEIQETP